MENYLGSYVQFSYGKTAKKDDILKIRQKKIVPNIEEVNLRREYEYENEWQQEYYIIYNSYILEEKDQEVK